MQFAEYVRATFCFAISRNDCKWALRMFSSIFCKVCVCVYVYKETLCSEEGFHSPFHPLRLRDSEQSKQEVREHIVESKKEKYLKP